MRISDFLLDQQIAFETLVHPPAFTAQKRAKFLRVSGRRVAKNVLLAGPNGFLLAILPATHHVDTARLALTFRGSVRLATAREISEVFLDCEWGVVSPFGRMYGVSTILDDSIDPNAWIVFEAHTHAEAVRMRCADYERLEQPLRLDFARPTTGRYITT